MYNSDALDYSNDILQNQIEYLLSTRPYIKQYQLIERGKAELADYLYGVDAIAITDSGDTEKVQFKARKSGNDFYIIAKKLSGKAANDSNMGFWYKSDKYALVPNVDIYIENIAGKNYTVTKNEILTLQYAFLMSDRAEEYISGIQPKYVYADDGSKFMNGDFYVFIPLEVLAYLLNGIMIHSNPNLFEEETTEGQI